MKGQLTQRDINLLDFCEKQLPISTDMAAILFYPNRYIAQKTASHYPSIETTKTLGSLIRQPTLYLLSPKKDLKNLAFTKLLCDVVNAGYDIESYHFENNQLTAIIKKDEISYQINSTLKNMDQVYKRLELIKNAS